MELRNYSPHYEISVNNEKIVFIYEPLACHIIMKLIYLDIIFV